jgi:seryl-tRNA synthetase
MLQVPYLRENTEEVIAGLSKRNNLDARERVHSIIALDDERKKTQNDLDNLLARANQIAREIGDLFKNGKAAEANILKTETAEIKEKTKGLELELEEKIKINI